MSPRRRVADRPYAVVDIDGVLADVRHRLHHITGPAKDWDAFFRSAPDDPPMAEGLAVAERLAQGHEVVYLSGRPERCRGDTLRWLGDHGLPSGRVLLRPEGDRRPSRTFKLQRLRELAEDRHVAVLVDDDPAVCATARTSGFVVFEATWMEELPALFRAQEDEGRT